MQMTCLREGHDSAAWREVKRTAEQVLESIEPLGGSAPAEREALNARVRQSIADGLQLIGLRAEQGAPLLVKVQQLQQSRLTPPTPAAQQTAPRVSAAPQPELNNKGEPLVAAEARAALYDAGNAQGDHQPDTAEPVADIASVNSSPELEPLPEVPTVRVEAPIMPAEALPAEPELVGDLPDIKAAAWVDALHTGSWFELMTTVDAPAQRCKLAAIISFSGKYIFVNRSGVKVVEYSATSLAQQYEQGLVRLLDDNQLFDRALESVIGNLRRLQARKN